MSRTGCTYVYVFLCVDKFPSASYDSRALSAFYADNFSIISVKNVSVFKKGDRC